MASHFQGSKILSDPLLGVAGLRRELGMGPRNVQEAQLTGWASGLERRVALTVSTQVAPNRDIQDFLIDNETGSLLARLHGDNRTIPTSIQYV